MIDEKKLVEELKDRIDRLQGCLASFEERMTLKSVLLAIEEMPKLGEWIPVRERLPEEDGNYLIYDTEDRIYIPIYRHGIWITDSPASGVLAWMPLPEPYKGVE